MDLLSTEPIGELRSVTGPAVWERSDIHLDSLTVQLSDAQRRELIQGARRAIAEGSTAKSLRREQVPLPGFQDLACSVRRCLLHGPGLVLVQRFPVDVLDEGEIDIAYLALSWQVGIRMHQNRRGDLLTRISPASDAETERLYKTRRAMGFHTDSVDIVGLLCVRPGASGGTSRIVSAGSVYNRMLRTSPELLAALYEPVPWDQHIDEHDTTRPWDLYAPITDQGGVPRIDYIGWDIDDAQRHASARDSPRCSPRPSACSKRSCTTRICRWQWTSNPVTPNSSMTAWCSTPETRSRITQCPSHHGSCCVSGSPKMRSGQR